MRALAKFDDANVIASRLRALGIPVNLFGRYLSLSSSEICSLLNGTKRLSKARNDQFRAALQQLEMLAGLVAPIPVDFRDMYAVSSALSQIADNSLIVAVGRHDQISCTPLNWD